MIFVLPDAIEEAARKNPQDEAVSCRGERLSYEELVLRCNQLANVLVDDGVRRGDRVGIFMDKSLETAVALYGIMKTGAAYVPLDPAAPTERLDYVVRHCGVRHLVTAPGKQRALEKLLAAEGSPLESLFGIDAAGRLPVRSMDWRTIRSGDGAACHVRVIDRDLAYIMYTSGSTGEPKGIMHTHASGLSYAKWAHDVYALKASDRLTNHAPLHFDLSTFDFFAGALAGSATVIVGDEYLKLPASYAKLLDEERITVFFTVPYVLIQLLLRGALHQNDLSSLRWVIFGGEPFPTRHLYELMHLLPTARFSNMYGPAEVNGCTYFHVPRDLKENDPPIPIGTTWRNADHLIVDKDRRPVEASKPGELLIRSGTMMKGYWGRPDLNERAFYCLNSDNQENVYYQTGDLVEENAEGNLIFHGRLDRQVKTRGYRVELDEVESALCCHPGVEEAAAFTIPDGDGSQNIHGAVTLEAGCRASKEEVLESVKRRLPWYAVPVVLNFENWFPRTSSGKIDRRTLREQALEQ